MSSDDEFGSDFEEDVLQRLPWIDTPLDPNKNEIRLLKLRRRTAREPIECSVFVRSLDSCVGSNGYETLSYVWGDPKQTRTIIVGGKAFQATENLYEFLDWLSLQGKDRVIWADAICIDQFNGKEKFQQLKLMGRIYADATAGHIWFGHFTESWHLQIVAEKKEYAPTQYYLPRHWDYLEDHSQGGLPDFMHAGGRILDFWEYTQRSSIKHDRIFDHAIDMLNSLSNGKHMYEFPLFLRDPANPEQTFVNRRHFHYLDCLRWMYSRPWWTRVWTLQEAILPRADPIVHAPPHRIPLSKLLNGMTAIWDHQLNCCVKVGHFFVGTVQHFGTSRFDAVRRLAEQRELWASKKEDEMLGLKDLVSSAQGREASDLRDHFFGVTGLLPKEWCDNHFDKFDYTCTAAELYWQCTKLMYANDGGGLKRINEAVGLRPTKVADLPTWAFDLSAKSDNRAQEGSDRWQLYGAAPSSEYSSIKTFDELAEDQLPVEVIGPIAIIRSCANRVTHYKYPDADGLGYEPLLQLVTEWREVYQRSTRYPDWNRFWRTAFMDRDIWRYWMHERKPMLNKRLDDIKSWWANYSYTKDDYKDLTVDKQSLVGARGDYHYRALKLNAETNRFFCTANYEPGLGPHDLQAGDEVYIIAGCKSPAVLRRAPRRGKDAFQFVGQCFVDGWMYGRAVRDSPDWRGIVLV